MPPTLPHADNTYLPGVEVSPALTALISKHMPYDPPTMPVNEVSRTAQPIYVYLNHGRWLTKCLDCPGATLAPYGDKRFFCPYCFNVQVDGKYRKVIWPSEKDIAGIEEAVKDRPEENKNWEVTESIPFLHAENAHFGVNT